MNYSISRNDLKELASKIELTARELQSNLENNKDFLPSANELVRNNTTLVFTLGEVHAAEQLNKLNSVQKPKSSRIYLRDKSGKFASK